MSTKTAATMEDVAALEQELEQRRADLTEAREAAAEAVRATRRDPDDGAALRQQIEAEARCRALAGRIEDLEAEVAEARQAALLAQAGERLTKGIPRAHGGVRSTRAAKLAEREELARKLERLDAMDTEYAGKLSSLELEAAILAIWSGLPRPDLPHTPGGGKSFLLSDFLRIEPKDDETVEVVGPSGRRTITGDSGRILALAGPWERTSKEATAIQRERMREKEAELQAERDEVDAWLRDQLANGPKPRDRIVAEAREADITVRSTNNTKGRSLQDARKRLGCLPLETMDGSNTRFWALPDLPYDEDAFRVYGGEFTRGAGAGAGMR